MEPGYQSRPLTETQVSITTQFPVGHHSPEHSLLHACFGVPAVGVVDSGADITNMSKELLTRVAAAAKLSRSCLKKSTKFQGATMGVPSLCMGR